MISIVVQRPPADNPGQDITDPLITTPAVAIARGTAEIDQACSDRLAVTVSGPATGWVAPGLLAQVEDAELGTYRGMITSTSLAVTMGDDQVTADINLGIERDATDA